MPGLVADFLEAIGPVVTSPGENPDRLVGEMNLHPVAVELDLMEPAVAGRHLPDGCRQRRFDEAGEIRLDADGRRFLALKSHQARSHDVITEWFVAIEWRLHTWALWHVCYRDYAHGA